MAIVSASVQGLLYEMYRHTIETPGALLCVPQLTVHDLMSFPCPDEWTDADFENVIKFLSLHSER